MSGELAEIRAKLYPMDFDMADKKEQMGMNNRPPGTDTSIIRNNKINIDIALIPPSIAEYNRSAFTSTEVPFAPR